MPVAGEFTDEILLNLCSGRISKLHSGVPSLASLQPIFDRAFAPELARRYPSAEELARAFVEASGVAREVLAKTFEAPPSQPAVEELQSTEPPVVVRARTRSTRVGAIAAAVGALGLVLAAVALTRGGSGAAPTSAPPRPVASAAVSRSVAPGPAVSAASASEVAAVPVDDLPRAVGPRTAPGAPSASAPPSLPGSAVASASAASPSAGGGVGGACVVPASPRPSGVPSAPAKSVDKSAIF